MNNVMLDLETMGTGNDAAILSIGACKFNAIEIGEKFYCVLAIKETTGECDEATVRWWSQQSKAAKEVIRAAEAPGALSELAAIGQFLTFISPTSVLWGNGATFDNIILRSLFRRNNTKPVWSFRNDLCYRTISRLASEVAIPRVGTYHNALDDAVTQARHLIAIAAAHPVVAGVLA